MTSTTNLSYHHGAYRLRDGSAVDMIINLRNYISGDVINQGVYESLVRQVCPGVSSDDLENGFFLQIERSESRNLKFWIPSYYDYRNALLTAYEDHDDLDVLEVLVCLAFSSL